MQLLDEVKEPVLTVNVNGLNLVTSNFQFASYIHQSTHTYTGCDQLIGINLGFNVWLKDILYVDTVQINA